MRLGVHMAMAGGFARNVKKVKEIGCQSIQLFPGNPTGWKMGQLEEEEALKRKALLEENELYPLVVHSAYLINLAGTNAEFLQKSKQLLDQTMERAALYGAPYVVLHAGNHGGQGVEKGLHQVLAAIDEGLKKWPPEVTLLLENTAGSGTAVGARFEDLGFILSRFKKERLGVCIDTAHSFAAGYDLSSKDTVEKALVVLDQAVGLRKVKVLHLNDSKVKLGSKVDRHAHIGEGEIGLTGFKTLLNQNWPEDLPVILETPENGTDWDRVNLETLNSLLD